MPTSAADYHPSSCLPLAFRILSNRLLLPDIQFQLKPKTTKLVTAGVLVDLISHWLDY
jgi:hypothetical protein